MLDYKKMTPYCSCGLIQEPTQRRLNAAHWWSTRVIVASAGVKGFKCKILVWLLYQDANQLNIRAYRIQSQHLPCPPCPHLGCLKKHYFMYII